MTAMSIRRRAAVSPEELELFTTDVMALFDAEGMVTEQDAVLAMERFGKAEREEHESAFPTWATLERVIRQAALTRRIAESKRLALGDGRLPGEDIIAYNKRVYEAEVAAGLHEPDDDLSARIAALNQKLALVPKERPKVFIGPLPPIGAIRSQEGALAPQANGTQQSAKSDERDVAGWLRE